MLWGDEVSAVRIDGRHPSTNDWIQRQIEYLVVSFDDEGREVKLSLRQADILAALANDAELIAQGGGVPELTRGPDRYAHSMKSFFNPSDPFNTEVRGQHPPFILNSVGSCWRPLLESRGELDSKICWMWNQT